jgi:hypothetical protein
MGSPDDKSQKVVLGSEFKGSGFKGSALEGSKVQGSRVTTAGYCSQY